MSNRKFTFGKYKGHDVESVINKDPRYVKWVVDNVNYFTLTKDETNLLCASLDKCIINDEENMEHREILKLMRNYGMHASEAMDFIEFDYPEYY